MSVDLQQLSAKELFDLANKKLQQEQQQEAQRAQLAARSSELKKRQHKLAADHEQALAGLDREYLALKQRRDQLISEHQAQIAAIEQELASLTQPADLPPPLALPVASAEISLPSSEVNPPTGANPAVAPRSAPEEQLASAIIEALKGRNDISDSLLREKLRVRGLPLGNLGKQLEKMVREGAICNKGGGNYSLRKKP